MVPYPIHETGRDVLFTTANDMTIVNIVNNIQQLTNMWSFPIIYQEWKSLTLIYR